MSKLRQLFIGAVLVLSTASAQADIGDALNSMYMVTGNEPNIYQSQRRLGIDAGYLRLRAPVNTFNVVNFSPPRFDAGCGGLDLFGGSFTFINAEQFRQMLRQIGANALGYAFKLALSSMCDDCDKILSELQDKMDALNRMQVDTCKWGAGLTIGAAEAIGFTVDEKYKMDAAGAGSFDDTFGAMRSLFEDPGADKDGGDASGADPNNKLVGNYTVKSLRLTNAAASFAFLSGNVDHIDLLHNIAGSLIIRGPDATETNEGDVTKYIGRRLTYEELKIGKDPSAGGASDAFGLLRCNDDACLKPVAVGTWSFQNGVEGWVTDQLQQAADHMKDSVTAAAPHTVALQQFLGSLPYTVMRHLLVLQGNEAALDNYVRVMAQPLAQIYASRLARQLTNIVRQAYDSSDTPEMPGHVKENLLEFERSAKEDERAAAARYFEVWKEAEDLVARHTKQYAEDALTITKRN